MANGETTETVTDLIFLDSKITADGDSSLEIIRFLLLGRKAMSKLDSILKNRDLILPTKVCLVKAMVFPVVMCGADHKESWAEKNWCFPTVVLEKALESPLDCKEIQSVHPKGNQSWIFIGRTDGEAGAPILWPSDSKNWLIRKDLDAGGNWRQEENWMTEDVMVGCHCQLNGHEFEHASGVGDTQGCLVCYSPWGHKELDLTEWLNYISIYSSVYISIHLIIYYLIIYHLSNVC